MIKDVFEGWNISKLMSTQTHKLTDMNVRSMPPKPIFAEGMPSSSTTEQQ